MDNSETIEWRVTGASVQGASHKRNALPNQDAILIFPETGIGKTVLLAIADGHGGKTYYRSDIGSQLAVAASLDVCKDFINKQLTQEFLKTFNPKRLKETLGRDIVSEWERRVSLDIQQSDLLATQEKSVEIVPLKTKRPAENNERTPYGSTLLTVIINEHCILYLQLGDGDILTVSADGEVQRPLPRDPQLIGNETTSLCGPHAWDDFIIGVNPMTTTRPVLILVSTDGYANSYPDDENFEKTAKDIYRMILSSENGIDAGITSIGNNLPDWLTETSDKGSGDDITVGIICNVMQLKKTGCTPLNKLNTAGKSKSQEPEKKTVNSVDSENYPIDNRDEGTKHHTGTSKSIENNTGPVTRQL